MFLNLLQKFLIGVGVLTIILSVSSSSFAQQGGCVYRLVGTSYLCVAIPGASSSQPPIVPDNTAVSDGNITYYGDGFQITPIPGVTYVPGYQVTPIPIDTQSPSKDSTTYPSPSKSPTPTTCNGGTCCTQEQLNMGVVCTIRDASAGCGCPTNWSCNYLGRNNSDGSQTIQCVPPANSGVPIGQACSPAGAPCAPFIGPDGKKYEANCGFNNSGNYVCLKSAVPLTGSTSSTNATTGTGSNTGGNTAGGTNTGIAGGNGSTCDPIEDGKIDENDFNVWKQEYLHEISTTRSACMSPNNKVDLLGFQAWKNIAILHIKTNF